MRTTHELIEELHHRADGLTFAKLVVGFPEHSEMVDHDDPAGLEKLNELLTGDGQPIGFIGGRIAEGTVRLCVEPLSDYSDDDQEFCYGVLLQMIDVFRQSLDGHFLPVNVLPVSKSWIN